MYDMYVQVFEGQDAMAFKQGFSVFFLEKFVCKGLVWIRAASCASSEFFKICIFIAK